VKSGSAFVREKKVRFGIWNLFSLADGLGRRKFLNETGQVEPVRLVKVSIFFYIWLMGNIGALEDLFMRLEVGNSELPTLSTKCSLFYQNRKRTPLLALGKAEHPSRILHIGCSWKD